MTERVRLRFGRNADPRTHHYNVYRSNTPKVGRHSARVLRVKQPIAPVALRAQEKLTAQRKGVYSLQHTAILTGEPITVVAGGRIVDRESYQLDAINGILFLDQKTDAVVTIDYAFDGIEVYDERSKSPESSVEYYGPDLSTRPVPPPPTNVSLLPEAGGMRINFHIQPTTGNDFYYAIESVSVDGSRSELSKPIHVHLGEGIMNIVLERQIGEGSWTSSEYGGGSTHLFDERADVTPPEPLNAFKAVLNATTRKVTFSWTAALANSITGLSPKYRLRVRGLSGELSEPSRTAGPEMVRSSLAKVVIYERNGQLGPAPYGDPSAKVITTIPAGTKSSYVHTLAVNGSYAYSAYVVDQAGNHSLASTAIITI